MNPNVIQFACGHCQSWLTVPAHMAGVAGPCPKCGNHIVSPQAQPQASFEPAPPPQQQPAPPANNWPPQEPAPQWPGAGINPPQEYPPQAYPGAGNVALPPPVMPSLGSHEVFPPAPTAPPMVSPPAWAQPTGGPTPHLDSGAPGGYPLHSQGLRPNAGIVLPGGHGPSLPPPVAPVNPVAGMMGQLPPRSALPEPVGQAGMLTRPAAVGGSRLSLLARQLTTPVEGGQGLPVAPAPLSTAELPGQAHVAHAAPDGSIAQQAGAMMLKDNMRRGLRVSHSSSRGKTKFALVALVLLGLLAGLVWTYRGPIKDVYVQVFPPTNVPEVAPPPPRSPVPGVDSKTVPPSSNKTQIARAEPTPPPEQVKDVKAVPIPAPEVADPKIVVQKPAALPQTSPSPTPPAKDDRDIIATMRAPRATAVDETVEAKTPTTIPVPEAPPNPLLEDKQKMVEVGRTSTEPKFDQPPPLAPTSPPNGSQPIVKNVPPVCKPALDGLLNFLNARKWQDRLKFIQLPDQMEPKLKLYYASNPDGPIDVDEIQYLRHDEFPQVGKGLHAVFVLFSRNWEFGFPVMVEVSPDGALVDWLTFIEFKDDMLNKFLGSYMEERVQFHVGIHRTHYFDESIPNLEQKEQFSVTSPMGNIKGFVFVPKGTPFARSIASTITWDKEDSFVVVELQWRKEGNAKWVEMTGLPQLNWYNAGAAHPKATAVEDDRPPPAPKGSVAR